MHNIYIYNRITIYHILIEWILKSTRYIIGSIISGLIISLISYFTLFFRPYIIELKITNPTPKVYDNLVILKVSNNMNFNLSLNYKIHKSFSLVRNIVGYLNIKKIKLKLLIGQGYSNIVFSTKEGISDNIGIIPAKATSSTSIFTCYFRLDENLYQADIIPEVELEFQEGTSRIKQFLAKNIFFRIKVNWKQGNRVRVELP